MREQREVSVAEFFEKNRHLLGFDNKRKALLTAVKEAVDNSLDACEEAKIAPNIIVELTDMGEERYRVMVEDNGPGIKKQHLSSVFGKLLYGSKFHSLSQSRGQQGIGISAVVLYAQLTTGRPAKVTSKMKGELATYQELMVDTKENKARILKEEVKGWTKEQGTRIEVYIEASYQKGSQSVDEYLKQTAIVNPHVTLIYTSPKSEQIIFSRATEQLPKPPVEIKPHPYGVEIGMLMRMLENTKEKSLQSFMCNAFSRVGPGTAKEVCSNAALLPKTEPSSINREMTERLMKGIQKTKIIAPPVDCISPITAELVEKGLRKEISAEFYTSTTRVPSVYRGNPFIIEVGIAYGGELPADKQVTLLRFANRVPLLYQQSACSITDSIIKTGWKSYGLQQSMKSMPVGPVLIMVHMASVWVPFTSEAKEALAHYPEIIKEIKLALQECGRKLGQYVNKRKKIHQELQRASLFEAYIGEVADSLSLLSGSNKSVIEQQLHAMLKKEEIHAQVSEEKDETEELYRMNLKNEEEHETEEN